MTKSSARERGKDGCSPTGIGSGFWAGTVFCLKISTNKSCEGGGMGVWLVWRNGEGCNLK